ALARDLIKHSVAPPLAREDGPIRRSGIDHSAPTTTSPSCQSRSRPRRAGRARRREPNRKMPLMNREPLVEDIQNYALNIVDTVREPLLILDTTLRVRSANRAFYQTFHVSSEETENRLIYELGNGQWDIPDLRRLLEDIVPKSSVVNDFDVEQTFTVIGRRVMQMSDG